MYFKNLKWNINILNYSHSKVVSQKYATANPQGFEILNWITLIMPQTPQLFLFLTYVLQLNVKYIPPKYFSWCSVTNISHQEIWMPCAKCHNRSSQNGLDNGFKFELVENRIKSTYRLIILYKNIWLTFFSHITAPITSVWNGDQTKPWANTSVLYICGQMVMNQ